MAAGFPPVGGSFGVCQAGRFFYVLDTYMDTNEKVSYKIRTFAVYIMGSTPTVSTFRGSVENTAFPDFC